MQRALFRRSTQRLAYYQFFHEDEAVHKLQQLETRVLPDASLALDKGAYVEPTLRVRVNSDGSIDLKNYELYPADGPDVVLVPMHGDKMSWNKDVMRRRAILSGIDIDDLA
ncbi:hypothetical protein DIPPA_33406 [Diplonema papillatum]|nr:hypothetical protein DIPPA_33406 [Diplonema papillatum]